VQDVSAIKTRRYIVPGDEVPGVELDGGIRLVGDSLCDGEEIVFIQRNSAVESQAVAVIPAQCNRTAGGKRRSAAGSEAPDGFFIRQHSGFVIAGPAGFDVIGLFRTRR